MPLIPSATHHYMIVMRPLDGDGYTIEEVQEASVYLIHNSGFHLFVTRGRIIRAIAGNRVIEVREIHPL